MNVLIQFELLVCSPKPPRLGNKPCYMPCLTAASNGFFAVVELHEKVTFFYTGKIYYPHSRIPTGESAFQTPV